jgi:hypothetical protein
MFYKLVFAANYIWCSFRVVNHFQFWVYGPRFTQTLRENANGTNFHFFGRP